MKQWRLWVVLLGLCLTLLPIVTIAQIDEDGDSLRPPYLPNATFAQQVAATRISSDTFLDEPIAMFFTVVGFPTDDDAVEALQPLADHYFELAQSDKPEHFYDYGFVSVGNLGDDRTAFMAESKDIAFGSSAKYVHILVRSGSNILYVWSVSVGGDAIMYLAEYLEGFLAAATSDSDSLVPGVSDLPIGWELVFKQPEDLLSQVVAKPTPTPVPSIPPTPTPSPTPAPIPTKNPLEPTIDALEAELRTAEAELDDARATIEVLEEAAASPSGLSPESVQLTVQVDLYGVLSGDRDAVTDAENELAEAFAPYLDDPNCTIGFLLILSRSNDLGTGVELSRAMGALLEDSLPSLIPEASDQLLYEAIALPGTSPVGEVQMEVFFYDACTQLNFGS